MSKNKKKQNKPDKISKEFAKMIWGIDEQELKKRKEVYQAQDKEDWNKIRQAQIDLKNSDIYKGKSFLVPDDVVVTIPISGLFKKSIQDTLNFCFSRMTKEEVIKALLNIQTNYESVKNPQEDLKPYDVAIWTLMNLVSEINFQAQEQGKLINSDISVGDQMTEFIEKMESDPNFKIQEELDKITKDYNKGIVDTNEKFEFIEKTDKKESKDEESDTNEG
jgi:hypothetical protein